MEKRCGAGGVSHGRYLEDIGSIPTSAVFGPKKEGLDAHVEVVLARPGEVPIRGLHAHRHHTGHPRHAGLNGAEPAGRLARACSTGNTTSIRVHNQDRNGGQTPPNPPPKKEEEEGKKRRKKRRSGAHIIFRNIDRRGALSGAWMHTVPATPA